VRVQFRYEALSDELQPAGLPEDPLQPAAGLDAEANSSDVAHISESHDGEAGQSQPDDEVRAAS
jgi:hypothetical protein